MTYKGRLALFVLIGGCAILASPLSAQEKKEATPLAEEKGPAKKSTLEAPVIEERIAPKPEVKSRLRLKKDVEGVRALGQPNDFWYVAKGGFHMAGPRGKGIFFWPTTSRNHWDTTWVFVDDVPVGGIPGWTYREDNYIFYMFFSKYKTVACGSTRYQVMWSFDNESFNHYDCAD